MRRLNWFLLIGVLFFGASLLVPAHAQNSNARVPVAPGLQKQLDQAAPDELVTAIVKVREQGPPVQANLGRSGVFKRLRDNSKLSQASLLRFLEQPSIKSQRGAVRTFWIDNLVLVQARKDVIEQIARRPDVVEVFDNFTVHAPPRETGPMPTHQSQPWDNIAHIGAKQVWQQYGLTGTGIRVGGLDTGVDISHPDIAGKMVTNNPANPTYPGGWAEFDANGNLVPGTLPRDTDQHGTHTSGTMVGGSASGFAIGVAPGARLMHGLVIPGGSGSFAQVAGGMEWIIDPDNNPNTDDGADVVNMSLGATGTFTQMIEPTDNMVAAGVFPSFSIGNSGPGANTTGSPGNVPSAYGVGATDLNDVIASFSSRGPVTWNSPPYVGTFTKPDISAPGVAIFSTVPGGEWEHSGWNGTSMAAPHVAGTVVLMRQANPGITVDAIKQILAQTALDLGATGMDNNYGWGRVNAFAAVTAALAGVGTLEGTVTSSGGGPVDGAMVRVVETGQRVFTDATGHYTMKLVAGTHTVETSRFGYQTHTANGVSVDADETTTHNVVLNQLPSGAIAGTVTDAVTSAGVAASISVKLGGNVVLTSATNPGTGAYSITLPVGTYDLVFNPTFPYPVTTRANIVVNQSATTTVNVQLQPAEVLLVDDDAGDNYETYYQQAIVGAGRSYLTVNTPPSAADMNLFEAVVWLTGDDYTTTLSPADEAAIAAFLDGGGHLFISGQDIGYDINTSPFYASYLHADYVQDNVDLGGVDGTANPVGFGLSFDIKGGSGANNQAYPEEMDPVNGGSTAFVYDPSVPAATNLSSTVVKPNSGVGGNVITSSGTAAITYEGAYRLVYFGFGFEAIANATDRDVVMDRVLDWLQGFPEITHAPLGDTEDTANPYVVKALITSDFFPLAPGMFHVAYSLNGGADATLAMTATGVPDEYSASIPAQGIGTEVAYYISASDVEGHTTVHPLGAPATRHTFSVAKDTEAPTVVHTPLRDTNDRTGPYTIEAEVTDNVGIEAVYLLYSKNGGLYHRVEMEAQSPTYVGSIPGPTEVGDQFDYYILAMDDSYSGNVTRHPASGAHHFTIVEEFVWDFELDDGDYTPAGTPSPNIWQWGSPTSGPGAAHSGVNLWATILNGNYPNSANATLDSPPITIAADRPYALFSFWHWYNMENEFDGGNVKVSTDGGNTFTLITPAEGYDAISRSTNVGVPSQPVFTGIKEFWQNDVFDLSAYAGEEVILRFHFGSDGSVQRSGWYIDDVRLASSSVDNVAPAFVSVTPPKSTFNTAGPYAVSASVTDLFSGVAGVSLFYNTNGGPYTEVAMSHGSGSTWNGSIPGQPAGTKLTLYLRATDNANNVTLNPVGAPGTHHAFSILPSADILVIDYSADGATTEDYRAALEANGHDADYWDKVSQGSPSAAQMQLYKMIVIDARSGLDIADQTSLAAFLNSGTQSSKKRLSLLGRDLGFSSATRDWISQYMRADYVQDDPDYREITGEAGDPIGMGETFNITGSFPDEFQRSSAFPGGAIVYRYSGTGDNSRTYAEVRDEYDKYEKEWDGVMPHAPISLDAAAGMRYNGPTYRSVLLAFNLEYVSGLSQRAAILHRVINWTAAPEIVHTPLSDTENTSTAYVVSAQIFSDDLDASRNKLTYDTGGAPVELTMGPAGPPNTYAASIPAQPFGTTVSYFIAAANNSGATSSDPAGAPAEKHSFRVLSDNVPPEIVHTPLAPSANLAGPYTVTAKVTDNVGVDASSVALNYNKNGGSNTTVPMTAIGGDQYTADIPGPSVVGDAYNYFITARDIAAVPNTGRSPATGTHTLSIVDFVAFDFEATNGGFARTGPDWEWGDPVTLPSDAHSGINVWGTKLSANYVASSNSRLESPPIVVPSSKPHALLSYWQWYDIEANFDGGNVKISTNGGATWTLLTPDIGYNGTARPTNAGIANELCFTGRTAGLTWHKVTFNLTPYRGQTVLLRWHFGSDPSVQFSGWSIDDVLVESVDDVSGPTFVSRTIPANTLNTTGPYPVRATVIDLLSGVTAVNLKYSTNGGSSYSTVAMAPTATPNEYAANIPGQPSSTRIKLYMEATDGSSNTSTDPAGAPGTTHQFGILPLGDYLVIFGGTAETAPALYADAFTTLGRSWDAWDWDTSGVPPLTLLNAYDAVIVDESSFFDAAQITGLTAFLDANDGTRQQVFFLGRDMQFGSSARPFMEKYTGTVYVQDNPAFFRIRSTPGDPIGNNETFVISGSFPDELRLSTTFPGALGVYKYNGVGAASDPTDEFNYRAMIEKEGKEWDPRFWPMAPLGPDSLAAARYVGTRHAAVYFAFNLYYIQEPARRAAVLGRALDWLASTATLSVAANLTGGRLNPEIPELLTLGQNYPNPFNPTTRIEIGIPAKHSEPVSLRIYNVQGQLVRTVFEGRKPAGFHSFAWDGTDQRGSSVASGVYFARFVSAKTHLTRKMVLLK